MKKIKVVNKTSKGFIEVSEGGVLDLAAPGSKTRRGRVQDNGEVSPTLDTACEVGVVEQIGNVVDETTTNWENPQRGRIYSPKGVSPCLSAMQGGGLEPKVMLKKPLPRIRKLTPKECFRLQGFSDEYFERARAINSDNQLYKQAGNSVTVNVIYEIARRL